jgi:hypothetical protein
MADFTFFLKQAELIQIQEQSIHAQGTVENTNIDYSNLVKSVVKSPF